jgi:hypothetical protein
MSSFRLGTITIQDDAAGELVLDGDGFAAAGELSSLLASQAVARYLGLSDPEAAAARTIADEYRAALGAVYGKGEWKPPSLDPRTRAVHDHLASRAGQLLGAERLARLKRLSWRILDGTALIDDEVAALLQLTPAQRGALAAAAEEAEQDNQRTSRAASHVRQSRLASQQPLVDAWRAAARDTDERLRAVLTPQQRESFARIKREP